MVSSNKHEKPWILKCNETLELNERVLMTDGEAREWTKEEFLLAVTEICAVEGNRIEWINARCIECNSDALE